MPATPCVPSKSATTASARKATWKPSTKSSAEFNNPADSAAKQSSSSTQPAAAEAALPPSSPPSFARHGLAAAAPLDTLPSLNTQAFDALQTALCICRPDGSVVFANATLLSELGVSARQMTSSVVLEWSPSPKEFQQALQKLCTQQISVYRFRTELCSPHKSPFAVIVAAHLSNGLVWFEIARLHEEGVLTDHLSHTLHASTDMLRNLAHEVRNPLGGIRGAAQLLQMDLLDPALTEYTQVILHEVDRLQSLVDRVLVSYRQRPHWQAVNIHEVCQRVLQLLCIQYPRDIQWQRDYDVSIPEIQADFEQLVQILLNLASNAAQALQASAQFGASHGSITLRTRIERQVTIDQQLHKLVLVLHVIDNGPGVPIELRERLFLPFVSGRADGHGLGLAIAQTLARQQHGQIRYQPLHPGSDFQLYLPVTALGQI